MSDGACKRCGGDARLLTDRPDPRPSVADRDRDLADAKMAALEGAIVQLSAERDDAEKALRRVVANESSHYDRYWVPGDVDDVWLDATEVKMREALTDVFCDDAAAIMLTLIAEIRRLRSVPNNKVRCGGDGCPGCPWCLVPSDTPPETESSAGATMGLGYKCNHAFGRAAGLRETRSPTKS